MTDELTVEQKGNLITVTKKKSRIERIYTSLGFHSFGQFLYMTILFGFAVILFGYLLIGIPQEAVKYELYKPYIDRIANCIETKQSPTVTCGIINIP